MKTEPSSLYPETVGRRAFAPAHSGVIESSDASGADASFVCGSFVRFEIRIVDGAIADIRYRSNGCGFMIAAAESVAELIAGRKLADLSGLDLLDVRVRESLGRIQDNRAHCLDSALNALRSALADLRHRRIDEFAGEVPLICTCFGVTESDLERCGANTLEEAETFTNAGTGCGSCRMLIEEILLSAADQNE